MVVGQMEGYALAGSNLVGQRGIPRSRSRSRMSQESVTTRVGGLPAAPPMMLLTSAGRRRGQRMCNVQEWKFKLLYRRTAPAFREMSLSRLRDRPASAEDGSQSLRPPLRLMPHHATRVHAADMLCWSNKHGRGGCCGATVASQAGRMQLPAALCTLPEPNY